MSDERPGRLLARLLAGSWRIAPRTTDLTPEEFALVAPLLRGAACAGLAWPRLAGSPLADEPAAGECREVNRWNAFRFLQAEANLRAVCEALRARGAEPLLVKGFALARVYEPGCRALGDFDLYVTPEALAAAAGVRDLPEFGGLTIDLHAAHSFPFDRPVPEFLEAGRDLALDGWSLRVPCPEDHLRLVCLHALGHGAWRAIWLCDAALFLETRGPEFDWHRFTAGDPRLTAWCLLFLSLAGEVLHADLSGTPVKTPPPRWAVNALLRQWEHASGPSAHDTAAGALRSLRDPRLLWQSLRSHWRNPFQALLELGLGPEAGPRPVLQAAATLRRVPRAFRR